ncbi:MAG: (2Fe-2S)-binding protein [Eubacterium sp.]|jgi:bacterioferritin-associated ferredoxin
MDSYDIHDPEYEVCLCRHVKRREIEKFIRESGVKTLKELCEKGKVGDKCGGCREDLETILNEVLAEGSEGKGGKDNKTSAPDKPLCTLS